MPLVTRNVSKQTMYLFRFRKTNCCPTIRVVRTRAYNTSRHVTYLNTGHTLEHMLFDVHINKRPWVDTKGAVCDQHDNFLVARMVGQPNVTTDSTISKRLSWLNYCSSNIILNTLTVHYNTSLLRDTYNERFTT